MQTRVIKSRRRTMSVEIKDCHIIVRVPYGTTDETTEAFLLKNKSWIDKHVEMAEKRAKECENVEKLSPKELDALADRAVEYIPARVRHFAPLIGVEYGRITIRSQRTVWGSCSSKGNLNFNCLLMLTPPEVIDSIVVHELCHLKHMNHSKRFYAEVFRAYPDYYKWNRWLKAHQAELLARLPK